MNKLLLSIFVISITGFGWLFMAERAPVQGESLRQSPTKSAPISPAVSKPNLAQHPSGSEPEVGAPEGELTKQRDSHLSSPVGRTFDQSEEDIRQNIQAIDQAIKKQNLIEAVNLGQASKAQRRALADLLRRRNAAYSTLADRLMAEAKALLKQNPRGE